jgi:hypothetical protein
MRQTASSLEPATTPGPAPRRRSFARAARRRPDRPRSFARSLLAIAAVLGYVLAGGLAMILAAQPAADLAPAVDRSLGAGQVAALDAGLAIDRAADAAAGAADVARGLASASERAADALEIVLFGVRPLAGAATEFRMLGGQASALAAALDVAADQSARAGDDLETLAAEVARTRAVGAALTDDPIGPAAFGWLGWGLVAWLAVQSTALLALAASIDRTAEPGRLALDRAVGVFETRL